MPEVTSFDGTEIYYDIHRKHEQFLVFVHGAGGDLNAWKKERAHFHRKGYSTLAVDLRGHGLSERPKASKSYVLDSFSKDVRMVLKKERITSFVMVGHCFGGMVTINFHRLFPSLAEGYVLIDTSHKAPQQLNFIFEKFPFITNKILTHLERYQKAMGEAPKSHVDHETFKGTGDWNPRRIYSDVTHTSLASWLFTYKQIASFDGTDTLTSMKKPVIVIEGERDSIFSVKTAKEIQKLVKKSILRILPKENHMVVISNPKAIVVEVDRFLSAIGFKTQK